MKRIERVVYFSRSTAFCQIFERLDFNTGTLHTVKLMFNMLVTCILAIRLFKQLILSSYYSIRLKNGKVFDGLTISRSVESTVSSCDLIS